MCNNIIHIYIHALFVCLTLLASFFHLSFKNMYVCLSSQALLELWHVGVLKKFDEEKLLVRAEAAKL